MLIGACGLDEEGLVDTGAADTNSPETGSDAQECDACAAELAAGWSLTLVGSGTCPSGYSQRSVVSDPDAGTGACTCACDPPPGACLSGNLTLGYATNCGNSEAYPVTGACQQINGGTGVTGQYSVEAPPPVSGSCGARDVPNDAAVISVTHTMCDPTATCDPSACSGNVPAGWQACVQHTGDMPCPPGAFTSRVVTGTAVSLTCAGCACSAANVQCAGALSYYGDTTCGTAVATIPYDAGCVTATGGLVYSYKWNGSVVDAGCSPTGPPTTTVDLAQKTTVCCR